MESDPRDRGEEFSVRLSWPQTPVAPPEDEPSADPEPEVAPVEPASRAPKLPRPRPASVRTGAHLRVSGAAPVGEAAAALPRTEALAAPPSPPRPAPSRPAASPKATPGSGAAAAAAGPEGSMARAFVDAFDRLAERLLDRLRTLRQDIDADLNGLRGEVATLRQVVEDTGQSVQLRQLHTGLDEARNELTALRRAVLEWPELERLSDEIASMRGDLSLVFDTTGDGSVDHAPSAVLGQLEEVVARLAEVTDDTGGAATGDLAWIVDEVAAVRTDLAEVLRRSTATVRLEPDQLALIADAVTGRLLEELEAGSRRAKRR